MFKSGMRRDKTAMTAMPVVAATALQVDQTVGLSPPPRPEQPDRATATRTAQLAARQVAIAERNAQRGRQQFLVGPVGRARTALERGDRLFQLVMDVESDDKSSTAVALVDDSPKTTRDPNEILNAVANEGWRLLSGSFVARDELVESRDDRGNRGAPAVHRITTGHYVFERASRLVVRPDGFHRPPA
jgi:hypothetical protein